MGAFPGTVQPISDISASLMAHLRYPEDLFKVQREILARYHVTDPGTFYGSNDLWKVPADPTKDQRPTRSTSRPTTCRSRCPGRRSRSSR